MEQIKLNGRSYDIDSEGFLVEMEQWDRNFAENMAASCGIPGGLTRRHWDVISFIRDTYVNIGRCPLVYQTCKLNGLRLKELKALFPTGYLRGACKIAGLTYKAGYVKHSWVEYASDEKPASFEEKTFTIDAGGFLVDFFDWDEQFAVLKSEEMKIPGGLTDKHWEIIRYLRNKFQENNQVPTIYETCEENNLELEDLEKLFPDGYHRGAVKIAGLRVL